MYNDYYLEQINNKLNQTNSKLDSIITNQNDIKTNQIELISGDKIIEAQIGTNNMFSYAILFIVTCILIYHYIERIFRC